MRRLFLPVLLMLALVCPALAQTATPPVITAVTPVSTTVPEYQPYQAAITINSGTLSDGLPPNNAIPYVPTPPSYQANLKRSESALAGISVDASLTAPNGTVIPWPCYWGQGVDVNGQPTGVSGWQLRGPTPQQGVWHGTFTATDAAGTTTSSQFTYTVTAPLSGSHGYVHVSPTDSRYFEYSDGSPFIAMGSNTEPQDLGAGYMQAVHAGGGTWLGRIWTPTQGLGVFGGVTQNAAFHSVGLYSGSITAEDAHSGRYCLSIPVPSGFGPQISLSNAPASTALTLTAYIKGVGETTSPPALYTSKGVCASVGSPDAHGWQKVAVTFTTGAAGYLQIGLGDYGSTTGHLLVDDMTLTNPAGGDLLGTKGDFEGQTGSDQIAAARLDSIVQAAQADNCFVKLVALNKFDQSLAQLGADGTTIGAGGSGTAQEAAQSLGGSTNANADTPAQRDERFYARYFVARWGAYPSVQSIEVVNEMDYNNGIEYTGSQAIAKAVHTWSRDGTTQGRILVTSSTTFNASGLTYDPNFYENLILYPDIDYADYHLYPDNTDAAHGFGLPYDDVGNLYNCRGSQRYTSGGPNGLGRLRFTLATQALGDPNNLQALWPLPTLRGQGTWTLSYWLRADAGATFSAHPNAQIHLSALPGGYMQSPAGGGVVSPSATWQQYSNTFTVSDSAAHQGGWLNLYACLAQSTPTGTGVEFGDVRLTAPDGQVFYRITFNEPSLWADSASEATYLAGGKVSYSGDPAIGKPLMVGESEPFTGGSPSPLINGAMGDTFARQAVWAGGLSPFASITQFWHEADVAMTTSNGWRFEGGVERFLAGLPLSNGHWRDWGGTASPTLRVVGQSDRTAGNAVLWVQNNGTAGDGVGAANWYNLATAPGAVVPVSGSIRLSPGPAGAYSVQPWDTTAGTATGPALVVTTDSSGNLTVPITGLSGDEAFRIVPVSSVPALTTTLTRVGLGISVANFMAVSVGVKSGNALTYTLSYANNTSSPLTGVTMPWPIPAHTSYASCSAGGVYDPVAQVVTWTLGTVAPGAAGTVTLTVTVQ